MNPMADASTIEQALIMHARMQKTPINGSLELLPLCNLNCKMCYVRLSKAEMEAQGRLRTWEEWLDVARQMKEAGVLFLLLTGGEPLMFPHFRELFVALKKMGMVLTINTNGTLLDEDWADFFAQYKPRRINITIYGSSEEMYRQLCQAPQGFEKATNAVRLLKARGVDVKISGSAAKANEDDVENIIRLGHSMNAPVAFDTYMMPATRERSLPYDFQSRLDPVSAARVRIRALQLEMTEETFLRYRDNAITTYENFVPGEAHEENIGCMAGQCSFTVNWKGHLQPCVILQEPHANVFEVGFREAWKQVSEGATQLKSAAQCSVCALRHLCRTCVASGLTEEGSYNAVPKYMCRYAAETLRLLQEHKAAHPNEVADHE